MKDEERQRLDRLRSGTWKAGDGEWLLNLVERLQSELDCERNRLAPEMQMLRDQLALAERQNAEARGMRMKAEFYQEHEKTKVTMLCQTCVLSDTEDPRHKWNDTKWIEAAKES